MRRDPRSLHISRVELSEAQHDAFLALCAEFTTQMAMQRPSEDWEYLSDLLDRFLQESFSRIQATGVASNLTVSEWRHLQTRFAEEVYASFGKIPPRLDARELGESPLSIRCLVCDRPHLISSCPVVGQTSLPAGR